MGAFVIATSVVDALEADGLANLPAFRKSSRGMIFSHTAVSKLLSVVPGAFTASGGSLGGICVGSSQGELGASKDFLEGIALKNMARPIIFQNSLHNSTLGYLTLQFGISGQAMTISNGYLSGEDALETSMLWLEQGLCHVAVALSFDLRVSALEEARDIFYPYGLRRGEGCAAVLLANEDGLRRFNGVAPLAYLNGVDFQRTPRSLTSEEVAREFDEKHYEADGISKLVTSLTDAKSKSPLNLLKPDGRSTSIRFERM